jgi:hypothetical protein
MESSFSAWTMMEEKTGSRSLSNQMRTCDGEAEIVAPTLGSEWSGKAWPFAMPGMTTISIANRSTAARGMS